MKKVKGSFLFKVTGDKGNTVEWLVDLKAGNGSVTKNPGTSMRKLLLQYSVNGSELGLEIEGKKWQGYNIALDFFQFRCPL